MKRVQIFWGVLAVLVLFTGCSDSESIESMEEQNIYQFPDRPDFGPQESSTKLPLNDLQKEAVAGLVTTDMSSLTAEELVAALIGEGEDAPTISNIQFTGASGAAGTFSGGTGIIGFEEGIILSSGDIELIKGPNVFDNITANNGLPGDADLNALNPGFTTLDATVLEFDFECSTTQFISFDYVFTSEEYNEYVNSQYNDIFAFYLNGENIALIPSSIIPVAINNVNCGNPFGSSNTNCNLFLNNDLQDGGGTVNTEMDGLTVVFTASAALDPNVTNHIKLVIADAGDHVLDSNVFIKGESFLCKLPQAEVAVDIHPGSCPNPLETKRRGVIPVSVSGSADLDVNDINVSSIALEGISPSNSSVEDVSTPYFMQDPENLQENDCHTLTADGFNDLSLKFDAQQILSALGDVASGEVIYLTLEGELNDGTPFSGGDVMIIR